MADIFIKIDGICGESQDATHRHEIEAFSWHWTVSQIASMHSGSGRGAGKASISDLHFSHAIDRTSPNLASYCAQGRHISQVKLTMRKPGGDPLEFYKIIMYDVIITDVSPAAGAGQTIEHVALSFARVRKEYVVQSERGGRQGIVTTIIDVEREPRRLIVDWAQPNDER
ncbi:MULTISPECIES: Hcp family type VI secretion system effector [unclassified Caballeronia]|uniref:Hcp family type VI secretion system effector n=1 Tax=unclassified Caballeronia TaxID=2646786 RepID=UPI003857A773